MQGHMPNPEQGQGGERQVEVRKMPVPSRSLVIVSQQLPFVKHLLSHRSCSVLDRVLSHDLYCMSESGLSALTTDESNVQRGQRLP